VIRGSSMFSGVSDVPRVDSPPLDLLVQSLDFLRRASDLESAYRLPCRDPQSGSAAAVHFHSSLCRAAQRFLEGRPQREREIISIR